MFPRPNLDPASLRSDIDPVAHRSDIDTGTVDGTFTIETIQQWSPPRFEEDVHSHVRPGEIVLTDFNEETYRAIEIHSRTNRPGYLVVLHHADRFESREMFVVETNGDGPQVTGRGVLGLTVPDTIGDLIHGYRCAGFLDDPERQAAASLRKQCEDVGF